VKPNLGPVLKRFDATLQLGGTIGIRGNSRTHRHCIGFGSEKHLFSSQRCSFALAV